LELEKLLRSLVIGASGQVGTLLYRLADKEETCVGTYFRNPLPGLSRLDLRDERAVKEIIREVKPDVCYLPGALTHVDYAEAHPQECRKINVLGTSHLARALAESHSFLVFFSTDHVFRDRMQPWKEDEPVSPQSVYAQSKAEAEQVVRKILPNHHLILRTSWVFGPDPQNKNFFWRVRRTLEKGESLTAPSDQFGQPTYGPDLARTARLLVEGGARGTFHVVGPQYLTRLAWARMIAETLHLPIELIKGRPTSELHLAAPRPLQVCLDRTKLLSFFGHDPIRPATDGINVKNEITAVAGPALRFGFGNAGNGARGRG
jgi:dTDP-4-dehydrorhamnose reductase